MSAPLADDVQTSPGAGLRCKGTKKNVSVQIDTDFFRKKIDIHLCISEILCNFAGQICI